MFRGPLETGVRRAAFGTNDELLGALARARARRTTSPPCSKRRRSAISACARRAPASAGEDFQPYRRDHVGPGAGDEGDRAAAELFPESRLAGWKYELSGTREEVLAKARRQLAENRTDLCIANGRAYGEGFRLVKRDAARRWSTSRAKPRFATGSWSGSQDREHGELGGEHIRMLLCFDASHSVAMPRARSYSQAHAQHDGLWPRPDFVQWQQIHRRAELGQPEAERRGGDAPARAQRAGAARARRHQCGNFARPAHGGHLGASLRRPPRRSSRSIPRSRALITMRCSNCSASWAPRAKSASRPSCARPACCAWPTSRSPSMRPGRTWSPR